MKLRKLTLTENYERIEDYMNTSSTPIKSIENDINHRHLPPLIYCIDTLLQLSNVYICENIKVNNI